MLRRVILSIVVGLVTWGVVLIIGAGLALVDPIESVARVVTALAWLFGICAGVWFFFTSESWLTKG